MARPRRYNIVKTKTENEIKRVATTPSTMAIVNCLSMQKKKSITLFAGTELKKKKKSKDDTSRGATYPERGESMQSPIPGP